MLANWSKRVFMLTAVGLAAGCSATVRPSAESVFLESEVVPSLTRWAKSSEPELSFKDVSRERDYSAICVVNEYESLDRLKKFTSIPIYSYHSGFGMYVPEYHFALVVVKSHQVHAAVVRQDAMTLRLRPAAPCVPAGRANFVRVYSDLVKRPIATLESK